MFYTYIMASWNGVAIYIGSTDDLMKRVWEHKNEMMEGHTKEYYIHKLVYYEAYETRDDAKARETRLKRWRREWKDQLIAKINPRWDDLYQTVCA